MENLKESLTEHSKEDANLSIYNMKLHEVITSESTYPHAFSKFYIMKVASGWIYRIWDSRKKDFQETFVPYADPPLQPSRYFDNIFGAGPR